MLKLVAVIFAGSLPGLAADHGIQGPVTAYYFDAPSGSVRAIAGVPGAAYLSVPQASGFDAVWMAPGGRMSLATKEGALGLVQYAAGGPSFTPLNGVAGDADRVVWSPDGKGAALYSSARNTLQVVTGFPGSPAAGPEIGLSSAAGAVAQIRLSPGSRHAAVSFANDTASSLYLLPELGSVLPVDQVADAGPMDFSGDGQSLYVVDRSANRLVNIPMAAPQNMQTIPLADATLTPATFGGLLASRDGKLLFVTLPGGASVAGLETAAWTTVFSTALDFTPSSLERLSGSLYVLPSSRDRGSPVWLLDGDRGAVYFVPAGEQNQ